MALTDREIELFAANLRRFLDTNLTRIVRQIEFSPDRAAEAAAAIGGLQQSLESLGLTELLADVSDIYGRKLAALQGTLEKSLGQKVIFTQFDIDATEALIAFDIDAIKTRVAAGVTGLKAGLFRSVLAGDSNVDQIVSAVGASIETITKTELNTGIAGFERSITQKKATDVGIEHFLYVGGLIETSRPFCIERDGQVFTKAQIDQWDNGQGLPAPVYLGGYNCRHSLIPVSAQFAKELGFSG